MRRTKISLIWKLVGINLLGVGLAVAMVWLVIDHFAADYFMGLMKEFKIDPKVLHRMFLHAIHQYLLLSMLLGLGVATLLGTFITRKVMRSLTEMNRITRRLAAGDYSERVRVTTLDEVGELGQAFNQMVGSLERIERMRKDLVANVAHELRTPLNNLRGQLEAIQDRLIPPSPETINALHEEVIRLVRLVEALHRLSRIDAGTEVMRRERFDLHALVEEIVKKERGRFEEKAIRLSVDSHPISVVGDADQIAQVVQNLVRNMLQYTPRGGEASLRMKREERCVRVSFINSGEGIRPEDLPYIFERFYRGEKSRSRESGGAGIGLAIVKQVVEAHGGSVGAESVPGKTEVWLRLPL